MRGTGMVSLWVCVLAVVSSGMGIGATVAGQEDECPYWVTHDPEDPDWILVRVVAGSSGAQGRLDTGSTAIYSDADDWNNAHGIGYSWPDRASFEVWPLEDGPPRISLNTGEKSVEISTPGSICVGDERVFSFGNMVESVGWSRFGLQPGETHTNLVFAAGGGFSSFDWSVDFEQGNGTAEVVSGHGSKAIASDAGTWVEAGPVWGGASETKRVSDEGLIGAMIYSCNACILEWRAPDGRSGTGYGFTESRDLHFGDVAFAGPAGDWEFSWSGLHRGWGTNGRMVAASVPIGEDWRLYDGNFWRHPLDDFLP